MIRTLNIKTLAAGLFFCGGLILSQLAHGQIWEETFDVADGTTEVIGSWTNYPQGADLSAADAYFEVRSNVNTAVNVGSEVRWESADIDISGQANVAISVLVQAKGLKDDDYFRAYYVLDGGPEVQFGDLFGKIGTVTLTKANLNGSTLKIVFRILNDSKNDFWYFDDVTVAVPDRLYSLSSGNWTDASIWSLSQGGPSCSCTPNQANIVSIEPGHTVAISSDEGIIGLNIESTGRLEFTANRGLLIQPGGFITVNSGGSLDALGNAGATLALSTATVNVADVGGLSIGNITINDVARNVVLEGAGSINVISDFAFIGSNNTVTNDLLGGIDITGVMEFSSGAQSNLWINNQQLSVNEILFDAASNRIENNSILNVATDLANKGVLDVGNSFSNAIDATFNVVNIDLANAVAFTFDNSGVVNMTGDFLRIPVANTFSNLTNATWNFSGANVDTDISLLAGASGNIFNYNSTSDVSIIAPLDAYYDLVIAGTGINAQSGPTTVINDLTVQSTLDMGVHDLTIGGDVLTTGTITAGANLLTLNGGDQQINLNGSSLYDLAIAGTGIKTFNGDLSVNNLSISSALFFAATDFALNIAGNLINDGLFDTQSSLITFNGLAAQQIGGSSVTIFNDVLVTGPSVTVTSQTELTGILNVGNSGAIDLGNNLFTIRSSSVYDDGAIGDLSGGGSVTGLINVERFITDLNIAPVDDVDGKLYRYLSTPVSGATIAQLSASGIPIAGNFSDADTPSTTFGSVLTYDAANEYYIYYPANGGAMATNPLNVGTGYVVYSYDLPADLAITLTGDVVTGDVSVPITAGPLAGYNLIGNPYPSAIDWDNVIIPAGMNSAVYLTDNAGLTADQSLNYTTYVPGIAAVNPPVGITEWTGEIAQGQSFWVVATANTSLTFQESNKTTNESVFYRKSPADNVLRIALSDGIQNDETLLHFNSEGTLGFDPRYDAKKLFNKGINLSQFDGEFDYAINTIPFDECNSSIGLRVSNTPEGTYSLTFTELESFTFNTRVKLIDNYLNQQYDVPNDYVHSFEINADAASMGPDRFVLQFSSKILDTNPEYLVNQDCNVATTLIQDTQASVVYSIWYNDLKLAEAEGNGGFIALEIDQDSLVDGINGLDLRMSFLGCDSIELPAYIVIDKEGRVEVTNVQGGFSCGPGAVTLTASGAGDTGSYRWYLTATDVDPLPGEESAQLAVMVDNTTSYFVSIINANGCESLARAEVVAEVRTIEIPDIQLNENMLLTTAVAETYQWYKDGVAIVDANSSTFQVKDSGIYTVEVSSNGCSAFSEEVIYEVLGLEDLLAEGIKIYPNPVSSWLNVNSQGMMDKIVLFDGLGQVYKSLNNVSDMSILMSDKPAGMYFVLIQKDGKVLMTRIMKHGS